MDTSAVSFNPNKYSDLPLYNIQAVAAATGVPSITLRSWERRYGTPEPKRDLKGYRLYSERDIAVARWLKDRVQQGVGISRAVNMLRTLASGDATPDVARSFDFVTLKTHLLDAITRMDEGSIGRVIAEALMVASIEEVSLKLLQPALYEVGELWASGTLSVTTEHVGSNLIRSHLSQLVRISPPPQRKETVLIGCAPGETHDIGALMLALFLRRRGFNTLYAGASVEAEALRADVLTRAPEAVCLSASNAQAVHTLAQLYSSLNGHYHGILAYGGRAFNENPELITTVPGTFLGTDADAATRNLDDALRRNDHR
jgi:methanogenic corrinoid protein MtbC1